MRIYGGVSLISGRPYAGIGTSRRIGGRTVRRAAPRTPRLIARAELVAWRWVAGAVWATIVMICLIGAFVR